MKLRIPRDWLHGIGEDSEQPLSGPAPDADAMIRQRQFDAQAIPALGEDSPEGKLLTGLAAAEYELSVHGSPDYQVTCARCGKLGMASQFMVEEGDEWECPPCWERCEANERARP